MINVEQTLISQYGNSATIVQLVENMNEYIDRRTDFQAFYDFVWNVDTAQGFGLDVWGRIVDVGRTIQVAGAINNFGFNDGLTDYFPFGQAPFYTGTPATNSYKLTDAAYRVLILTKALSNISATTAPAINQILQNLFKGRGRAYISDLGGMQMRYTFEFYLFPYELAIINQSGVFPHPAGVSVSMIQVVTSLSFGFNEAGLASARPFNEGAFFSELI